MWLRDHCYGCPVANRVYSYSCHRFATYIYVPDASSGWSKRHKCCLHYGKNKHLIYIYIFIAIALDETIILVAVHFQMQNIYQSYDLYRALEWSNVNVSQ